MDLKKLIDILLELRQASHYINACPSDENFKNTIKKFDMLFLGENFNCIYSSELEHSIKTIFNIPIEDGILIKMIPSACDILKMKYEPMVNLSDVGKPNVPISCYQITL